MNSPWRRFSAWIVPATGAAGLAAHVAWISPYALGALVLSLAAAGYRAPAARPAAAFRAAALGWLVWPARLFYWDSVEFSQRVSLLTWMIALLLTAEALRRARVVRRGQVLFGRRPLGRRLAILFLAAWLLLAAGAAGITLAGVPLLGDEPHYLVIAQSLVEDGDLNVANQYAQRRYRRFIPGATMGIHGFFGWKDNRFEARRFRDDLPAPEGSFIYSIHLPGAAVVMMPLVLLPSASAWWIFLVRAWFGLIGAGIVVMAYLFGLRLMRRRHLALQVALVALATPPLFFHSLHVYPDAQVLLMLLAALYLLLYRRRLSSILGAGLILGLLLFWGVKYAIFTWLFTAGFAVFFLKERNFRAMWRLLLFPLIFQGLFMAYLFHAYGNVSPMSVYMNYTQKLQFRELALHLIPLHIRVDTFLDYFLDQRDGLLPYAPVFFLALPGLFLALRRWRRHAATLLLAAPAAVFIFSYAFLSHRGGQCPQARPLIPVLWALLLLVMVYLREGRNAWMRRAWRWLPLYGAGVILFQVLHPWTLYQPTTHNVPLRAGLMFQLWSPLGVHLDRWLPSFAKVPGNWKWWPNPFWLVLVLLFAAAALIPMRRRAVPARCAGGLMLAVLLVLAVVLPRVPDANPTLVTGDGMLPHRILGAAHSPRRVQHRRFELEPGRRYSFTLATTLAAGGLEVFWKGDTPPPFDLRLFDTPVGKRTRRGWRVADPPARPFRGLWIYRIHLVPRRDPAAAAGELELRPLRHPRW